MITGGTGRPIGVGVGGGGWLVGGAGGLVIGAEPLGSVPTAGAVGAAPGAFALGALLVLEFKPLPVGGAAARSREGVGTDRTFIEPPPGTHGATRPAYALERADSPRCRPESPPPSSVGVTIGAGPEPDWYDSGPPGSV